MRLSRLNTEDGIRLIEPFMPDGNQYETWKALGLISVGENSKKLWMLYSLSGQPKIVLGNRISSKVLFKNAARLDSTSFKILLHDWGLPGNNSDRGQLSAYSVDFWKQFSDAAAGVVIGVSEPEGIGCPSDNLSNFFLDLAEEWSTRFSPSQLFVECSDIAREIPTNNTPPSGRRPWIPGYCWILLLPPGVVKVLGGVENVLREAPVADARQVVFGKGDVAILCRLGPKPGEIPEQRWREWKEYLQPVLGEAAFPRKKFPWILPEDSA